MKRKTIAYILCTCLVLTSFCETFAALANGDISAINIPFISNNINPVPDTSSVEAPEPIIERPVKTLEEKIEIKEIEPQLIYTRTKQLLTGDEKDHQDLYNLNKADVEELMSKGFGMKDIIEADDVANRVFINPKELLERKKNEDKSFEELELEIKNERLQSNLEKLKKKHPEEHLKIEKHQLSEKDQLTLLACIDLNDVASIDTLIEEYKKNGQDALKGYQKTKKLKASKDILKKHNLTEQEAQGFSDQQIERLAELCKKRNRSVKDELKSFKESESKVRRVNR